MILSLILSMTPGLSKKYYLQNTTSHGIDMECSIPPYSICLILKIIDIMPGLKCTPKQVLNMLYRFQICAKGRPRQDGNAVCFQIYCQVSCKVCERALSFISVARPCWFINGTTPGIKTCIQICWNCHSH